MRPLASMPSLAPDAPIVDALEMMRDEDAGAVPVVSGGQLRGLLSRRSIMEYMQILLELQRSHVTGHPHLGSR
jgi:CBS domain-containing protein